MLLITIRRLHSRRCRVGRIRDALVAASCVTQDDLVQKDALDLCLKQHALGLTHLMVPSSNLCAVQPDTSDSEREASVTADLAGAVALGRADGGRGVR